MDMDYDRDSEHIAPMNKYQTAALKLINTCSKNHDECEECPIIPLCQRLWDTATDIYFFNKPMRLYDFKYKFSILQERLDYAEQDIEGDYLYFRNTGSANDRSGEPLLPLASAV